MRTFYDPVSLVTAILPAAIGAVAGAINKPSTPKPAPAPAAPAAPAAPDPKIVARQEQEAARRAALQERTRLSNRQGRESALGGLALFAPQQSGSTRRTLGAS